MDKMKWMRGLAIAGVLMAGGVALGQEKAEEIKIVVPTVDPAAHTVTLPGAFWNEHLADWLEVALCGRPSDFLHETLVSVTTTRSLLEKSLRDIGCHDGDAWVDNVQDFPRLRGDHLMVVVEFERDGKKEKYSLDELITFNRWGVPLGPYGFLFKGDPDHQAAAPAATGTAASDSTRILRDDPQIALVFRGLQSMSQSFADHPLAYVESRWEWEEINRGRNNGLLPATVYDSNGKTPLTVTFKRVSEEELITESAKLWHDEAYKAYMLKQVETATRIDKNKAEYLKLREGGAKLGNDSELAGLSPIAVAAAEIARDYAALDAAWAAWAVEHVKPATDDPPTAAFILEQAKRWGEYMALNKERAEQLALHSIEMRDEFRYRMAPDFGDAQVVAQYQAARDRALVAISRATIAENKQSRDYWQQQWDKIQDPKPDDIWAKSVRLHLDVVDARLNKAAAGIALGQETNPRNPAKRAELDKALQAAHDAMVLAEARLSLANVEFEISKRVGMPEDAELTALKKQRDELQAKIKELEGAKP